MKLKRNLCAIILIILLLLIPDIVKAETTSGTEAGTGTGTGTTARADDSLIWTDVNGLRTSFRNNDSYYKLEITGITELQSHQYYIFFTNNNIEPTIVLDNQNWVSNYDHHGLVDVDITDQLERKGDIYLWICEQQKNEDTNTYERKFIVPAKKIERPEQRKLGSRIYVGLTNEKTNIVINEPHTNDNERKVVLAIGQVTDKSILLSIKNGEADSLSKLFQDARKTASTLIYNDILPVGKSKSIINDMNLIDNAYYYIFSGLVVKDEDGKEVYNPVEDISLVQARVFNDGSKSLLTDINWDGLQVETPKPATNNTNTDKTTANTSKLPQTGENVAIIAILVVLVGLGVVLYFKNKQYRDIK